VHGAWLLAGILLIVACGAKDDTLEPEQIMREVLDASNALVETLGSVSDADSALKARPKIRRLATRVDIAVTRLERVLIEGRDLGLSQQTHCRLQTQKIMERLGVERARLRAMPEVAAILWHSMNPFGRGCFPRTPLSVRSPKGPLEPQETRRLHRARAAQDR